ncbi:MAG: DHH family phosphoesterase [Candidatus Saccharimonadales bacterium]
MINEQTKQIGNLINESDKILIVQADNPDADSLGSALAISEILAAHSKDCYLYCAVDIPSYLKYMQSWSLVENKLSKYFDLAIIVDTATDTLLEKIKDDRNYAQYLKARKIVLDHHQTTDRSINSEITAIDPSSSSTAELIYTIFNQLNWDLPLVAKEYLMGGILGDTQGLSNNLATPRTYRIIADIIEQGVNRGEIENRRRKFNQYTTDIFEYKGNLINKTQLHLENKLAIVTIPHEEIVSYSAAYNPSALIMPDLLQIENLAVGCVVKIYNDGRVTGTIRTNSGYPIAAKIAERFGGGGHDYASGFKVLKGEDGDSITKSIIDITDQLITGGQ